MIYKVTVTFDNIYTAGRVPLPPPPPATKTSPSSMRTFKRHKKEFCVACSGEKLVKDLFTGEVRTCFLCLGRGYKIIRKLPQKRVKTGFSLYASILRIFRR